jgi:hypothetical protein
MEGLVDQRLKDIGLSQVASITDGLTYDCLFQCFAHRVQNMTLSKDVKELTTEANVKLYKLTFGYGQFDEDTFDVSSVQGLRDVCSAAAYQFTHHCNPHANSASFIQHMKHRFASTEMNERDATLGGEALPAEPTDEDYVDRWCHIIQHNGVLMLSRCSSTMKHAPLLRSSSGLFSVISIFGCCRLVLLSLPSSCVHYRCWFLGTIL